MRSLIVGSVGAIVLSLVWGCAPADDADTGSGVDDIQAEQPLTAEGFRTHPRIVEVQKEVDAIEAAIQKKTIKSASNDGCAAIGETGRTKFFDAKGKIRKLVINTSGEHSSLQETFYYGTSGKLRFAFEDLTTEQGFEPPTIVTASDKRFYFNTAGEMFWLAEREARNEEAMHGEIPDIEKAPFTQGEVQGDVFSPDLETNPERAFSHMDEDCAVEG